MKRIFCFVSSMFVMVLFPAISGAVGTYYNGNLYQNPQQKYNRGGYYNSYGAGSRYGQNVQNVQSQLGTQKQQNMKKTSSQASRVKQGFVLDAGLSHQMANWEFDMSQAGSKLHYDNLAWNVFDAKGVYYFGDTTKMQVNVGLLYGLQFGESPMIDDDISNGGTMVETYYYQNTSTGAWDISGYQTTHALSAGTSKGGNQFGFNVGFGLTDAFNIGKSKVTPSVGFRYFKYKLTTERNYGVTMDIFDSTNKDGTTTGIITQPGESQWPPFLLFASGTTGQIGSFTYDENGNLEQDVFGNFIMRVPSGADVVDFGNTFYYEQSGTSHEYETSWMGPYLALDMEYQINNGNFVTAGVELGLPIYKSEGKQPYRTDWLQSPSVEDKGNLGDAYHFGLNANWITAISGSTSLSVGFTYDYYNVSGANAKTYLNPVWYSNYLDVVNAVLQTSLDDSSRAYYEDIQSQLESLQAAGWVTETKDEVKSVYKSIDIRVGVNVAF